MSAKYILFFRIVLLITLLLQSMYAQSAEHNVPAIAAFCLLYGGFAWGWFLLESGGKIGARAAQWSFMVDLAAATAVLYMNPGNTSEYHIAFFLVVLSSAFLQRPPFSFLLAAVACVIYGSMSLADTGDILRPEPLLRLALLMVMAFFSTSMVETARKARAEEGARLESRIEWMERLSKIGRALSGILHEVKTPLGTISLASEYAEEMIRRGEPIEEQLRIIRQEAERATQILLNFLEFTRPTDLQLASVDFVAALEEAISAMKIRMEDSEIERDGVLLPEARVMGSHRHLVQMFTNLLMNAIKAMPMGGTLKISQEIRSGRIVTRIDDTGTGIAPEDLPKLFEPYHTSLSTPESYGLGLTICKWIAEKHHGELRIESAGLGRGASVIVDLPAL